MAVRMDKLFSEIFMDILNVLFCLGGITVIVIYLTSIIYGANLGEQQELHKNEATVWRTTISEDTTINIESSGHKETHVRIELKTK